MSDDQSPVNLAGAAFLEIKSIGVHEYHPLPDGKGDPTEVHLTVEVQGIPWGLALRFKTGHAIDELIVALITHRRNVFGGPEKP